MHNMYTRFKAHIAHIYESREEKCINVPVDTQMDHPPPHAAVFQSCVKSTQHNTHHGVNTTN